MNAWDSADDVLYRGLVYAGGDPNRTPWDDIQDLAETIGWETFFEPRTVTPPPVFCEPQTPNHVVGPDFGWPYPQGVEPDVDDPLVCRVHDEWWPCAAVRAGRPVTFPPPTVESVLVCRPKEADRG